MSLFSFLPWGSSQNEDGSSSNLVQKANDAFQTNPYTPAQTVPDTAAAQQQAAESARVNPLDKIKLSQSAAAEAIQNFRDDRHKTFIAENKFAVRLRSFSNDDVVAFRVSPEIQENRSAAYKTVDPLHMPGAVQVYTNSAPRTWALSGIKLISRNGVEAEENLATINQLRSWMMPFFGKTNTANRDNYEVDMLGAPPEVLKFTAYSDQSNNNITNIRNIPVVMTNLSIPYPTDVDYIETATTKQPFPAVMNVDIMLVETHSPQELSNFDLIDFRHGKLPGF